jgi:hypothetical protein
MIITGILSVNNFISALFVLIKILQKIKNIQWLSLPVWEYIFVAINNSNNGENIPCN